MPLLFNKRIYLKGLFAKYRPKWGANLAKQKGFSYYDIEDFLREAGAERINEKAVKSFEEELESFVKEMAEEAEVFANYAGRRKKITNKDIEMAKICKPKHVYIQAKQTKKSSQPRKKGIKANSILIGKAPEEFEA